MGGWRYAWRSAGWPCTRSPGEAAAFLAGQALDAETVRAAADLAAAEFQTIGDVRGAAYRRALIRHHVIHHLESLRATPNCAGGTHERRDAEIGPPPIRRTSAATSTSPARRASSRGPGRRDCSM